MRTLKDILQSKGFEVTKQITSVHGVECGCVGSTPQGKKFVIEDCAGAWGEYSLYIEGLNRTAHCKLATAIKKIRSN